MLEVKAAMKKSHREAQLYAGMGRAQAQVTEAVIMALEKENLRDVKTNPNPNTNTNTNPAEGARNGHAELPLKKGTPTRDLDWTPTRDLDFLIYWFVNTLILSWKEEAICALREARRVELEAIKAIHKSEIEEASN